MRNLIITLLFTSQLALADDFDLFVLQKSQKTFSTQTELADFLKQSKPSTFIYFNKLDPINQNLVFQKHQENTDSNLTKIVLDVYKSNRQTQKIAAQD